MDHAKRRKKLSRRLGRADAMLITNETNVRYLTGFTGDSTYLIIPRDPAETPLILSDPRYEQQLAEQCPDLKAVIRKPSVSLMAATCRLVSQHKILRLLIEPATMSVAMHDQLQQAAANCELLPAGALVEQLRMLKDNDEIELIRRAVHIAQRAFQSVCPQLTRKHTELQVVSELEYAIRRMGGAGCSFAPIVGPDARAALPHADAGKTLLGDCSLLLIDWGAVYEGYRSDLTRVLLTSRIPAKISRAYEAVLSAQQAAIDVMKPGVTAGEVDRVAREVLADAGLAKRFTHGLGHGIGLDIHEAPRLGQNQDVKLQPGMVVTVEPGVYLPGVAGIRIEDDVLITSRGAEVLSCLPRDMSQNQIELLD